MEIEHPKTETQKWFEEYLDRTQPPFIDGKISMNLDYLRTQSPQCVQSIIQNPTLFHKLTKEWNKARMQHQDGKKGGNLEKQPTVNISFEGNLGTNFVTPRGLGHKMANQLVGIQGIVTRTSVSRYHLQKSVHFCQKTSQILSKQYANEFSADELFDLKKNKTIPTTDINNNPLKFEFGKSSFRNFQTAVIQQLPEMAPAGQLPRSVNAVLQDDLVDKLKPGDRVQVIGVYKLQPGAKAKQSGIINALLICTSVVSMTYNPSPLTSNKLTIKLPYDQDRILQLFSHSICPSVYGHEYLKKAVLLMLVGGCQKVLDNGAHLRGDINLLMIGDPGTAKSQMLQWVLSTVDVGINTTGSGASGVGLTAAITMDKDTGQRNIEAGAMVLADGGFVCIDEFDKMQEADRVAVHEVMEQQTVTIAKAGIHVSLNARCSVIAAANPIYGEYQRDLAPTKNIGMPDSLLSRFDLIFIIFDERDAETDKRIAQRVCKNHRYSSIELISQNNVEEDYIIQPIEISLSKQEAMFEKSALFKGISKHEILSQAYVKKYVNHCRKNVAPILCDDSIDLLARLWACLREKDFNLKETGAKVLPITIRSYETLIRLSTAHAKLRLSSTVDLTDCVEAFKLITYCIYKDEFALDKQLREAIKLVYEGFPQVQEKRSKSKNKKSVPSVPRTTSVSVKTQNIPKQKSENRTSRNGGSVKKQLIKRQQSGSLKRIHKIKINEEDLEIERAMRGSVNEKERKRINGVVFTAFTALIKDKRDQKVKFSELAQNLPSMTEEELRQTLRDLDQNQKILFDEDRDIIHCV